MKTGTIRTGAVETPWCIIDDANRISIGIRKERPISANAAYRGSEPRNRQNTRPAKTTTGIERKRKEMVDASATTTMTSTSVGPKRADDESRRVGSAVSAVGLQKDDCIAVVVGATSPMNVRIHRVGTDDFVVAESTSLPTSMQFMVPRHFQRRRKRQSTRLTPTKSYRAQRQTANLVRATKNTKRHESPCGVPSAPPTN